MNTDILQFQSDYQEACHENILKRLTEEYRKPYPGYGSDSICEAAKEKIRKACPPNKPSRMAVAKGNSTLSIPCFFILPPFRKKEGPP